MEGVIRYATILLVVITASVTVATAFRAMVELVQV